MPRSSAVLATPGPGADRTAMVAETTISTTMITKDCHMKIVSENGMTPVMASSGFGRLPALACSWAAEEERPSAQVAPSPR